MLIVNTLPAHREPLAPGLVAHYGPEGSAYATRFVSHRADHAPTPLVPMPALAAELGVAAVHIKDESGRFGLGSFKALGGAYAVAHLVLEEAARQHGRAFEAGDLDRSEVREVAASMTFACATDGNHGRSVAQGAAAVGARANIFVHEGVSDGRVAAIARYGATMTRVAGTYDDSVREAARVADQQGWTIVSDTAWPGYERIPTIVMQGYTVMVAEALAQSPAPPTHVFVQAGVGGLAAAVAAHLAAALEGERPATIVVEPARAACVLESARAGSPVRIPHGEATVMAMLECYEPSLVAWPILERVADAFMTVDEDDAVAAMRRLARPAGGDPRVVAGESGGVGLAGLIRVCGTPADRAALAIDARSRVLVFNTEGATDPERYLTLTGSSPA